MQQWYILMGYCVIFDSCIHCVMTKSEYQAVRHLKRLSFLYNERIRKSSLRCFEVLGALLFTVAALLCRSILVSSSSPLPTAMPPLLFQPLFSLSVQEPLVCCLPRLPAGEEMPGFAPCGAPSFLSDSLAAPVDGPHDSDPLA